MTAAASANTDMQYVVTLWYVHMAVSFMFVFT